MTTQKNTGRLCSVYCPSCGKVTDKISWNLLREAKRVDVTCPLCGDTTRLEYEEGRGASVLHNYADSLELAKKILESGGPGNGPSPRIYKNEGLMTEEELFEALSLSGAKDDEDANLTPEKIQELHNGVEKRIDELSEKALARLAEKRKNSEQ